MTVQITALKNGPLKVEGDAQVLDSSGKPFPTAAGKSVFLCRCGHSSNKPFCDGTHKKEEVAFASEVKAP